MFISPVAVIKVSRFILDSNTRMSWLALTEGVSRLRVCAHGVRQSVGEYVELSFLSAS